MRPTLVVLAFCVAGLPLRAVEPDPKIKPHLEAMAAQRSSFQAKPLHELGTPGLEMMLNYFFPETAPVPKDQASEKEVRELLGRLGHDDFKVREQATVKLIASG